MKKVLFLLLAMAASCVAANAQVRITGRTVNASDGKAAGYVTVSAERDTTVAAVVYSDADGRFALEVERGGEYDVKFAMVGFRPVSKRVDASADADMGDVALEEGEMIDGVKVVVQKPIITHTAEKLTYEVDNDPQSSTSTLEEIIRKVPQLSIDAEGKVLINGESNYKILVNGHAAGAIGRNFSDVIKSMPASQIKRIEVITNPSIKYDAEGAGGILNIITSGRRIDGFDGSLSDRMGFGASTSNSGSVRVALQTGKFAFDLNGYGGYYSSPMKNNSSFNSMENLVSDANRFQTRRGNNRYKSGYYGVSLTASYQITDSDLLTLDGGISGSPAGDSRALTEIEISDAGHNPMQRYTESLESSYEYLGGSATVSYEHRFDEDGNHTLSFSDNVDISPDNSRSDIFYTGDLNYVQTEAEDSYAAENTFQADYSRRLGERHTLGLGVKHIYRNSSQDNLTSVDDVPTETSFMRYTQNVGALYGSYEYGGEKWSASGGVRVEGTWNAADVESTREGDYSFDNSFWNVIPYASVSVVPAVGHSLSLTYTERLGRPSIWQLSPYETVTPTTVSAGNPDLESEVSHSVSLKYAYVHSKWNVSVSPAASISNNGIAYYSEMRDDGIHYSGIENGMHWRRIGASATLMFRPSEKFSLSLSARAAWAHYSLASQDISTEGWGYSESLNMEIRLWKGATLSVNEYLFRSDVYLGSTDAAWNVFYGFYLTQKFLKDRLTLTFSGNNPFRGDIVFKSRSKTPTYISLGEYRSRNESYSVGLSWRFGKKRAEVKSVSKSISNDDSVSGGGTAGAAGGSGGGQ